MSWCQCCVVVVLVVIFASPLTDVESFNTNTLPTYSPRWLCTTQPNITCETLLIPSKQKHVVLETNPKYHYSQVHIFIKHYVDLFFPCSRGIYSIIHPIITLLLKEQSYYSSQLKEFPSYRFSFPTSSLSRVCTKSATVATSYLNVSKPSHHPNSTFAFTTRRIT